MRMIKAGGLIGLLAIAYCCGADLIHYKVLDNQYKCDYHDSVNNDWDYMYESEIKYLKPNDTFMHMKVLAVNSSINHYSVFVMNKEQFNTIQCNKLP